MWKILEKNQGHLTILPNSIICSLSQLCTTTTTTKEHFQMLPQSLETEKLPVSNMLSKKVFLRFDCLEFE